MTKELSSNLWILTEERPKIEVIQKIINKTTIFKKLDIKIENFKSNKNKICYMYILTPKGIKAKTKLTVNFMKKKMNEYEELKKEI